MDQAMATLWTPSPKCHQGFTEHLDMKLLIVCHKVFLEERTVLSARCEVLDDVIDVIDRKII